MASRGNKPLQKKESIVTPKTLHCLKCNDELDSKEFYDSDSELHESIGKIPYCRSCLDEMYHHYLSKYKKLEYLNPERKAVERLCMALDIYYSDKVFDSAIKLLEQKKEAVLFSLYLKQVKLYQYRNKNYDTTINDKYKEMKDGESSMSVVTRHDEEKNADIKEAIKLFGNGFTDEDYLFLYDQYIDWTTRHECETKSQEEVFKQMCFTQLELWKAAKAKQDTKDLNATFLTSILLIYI